MSPGFAWLHPRLHALPREARRAVLRASHREPFDAFELVALGALVVVAGSLALAVRAWIPLVIAATVVAAVLLRRCRRALRRMLDR